LYHSTLGWRVIKKKGMLRALEALMRTSKTAAISTIALRVGTHHAPIIDGVEETEQESGLGFKRVVAWPGV